MTKVAVRHESTTLSNVEAFVFEEDTGLVLSADSKLSGYDEHPIRLMTSLLDMQTQAPGSVLVKGENPYRMFAIVHDLDREQSCQESFVLAALKRTLILCDELEISTVGMQMLGSRHGPYSEEWFQARLAHVLEENPPKSLVEILLLSRSADVTPIRPGR